MNNDQIIQKIKTENLKPISRNTFLIRKALVWFLLAMTTIFGAYTFAFFFLKTLFIDFENWHYFANSYNMFLISKIPVMWIVFFIISLLMVSFLFKKTGSGYKYSVLFIGAISLFISFFLGIALSKTLSQKGFLVERFERERVMDWTNPESGRLSGEVLFIGDTYILLRDISDNIWNIDTSYILDNSKEVVLNSPVISVIGKYDYENNFTACQIIPLNMDRKRFKPKPENRLSIGREDNDDFVKDLCDFVINQN